MAETYVTLHGLARAVTNLLQRTNTRTMFTAAHPIGEIIETTPNLGALVQTCDAIAIAVADDALSGIVATLAAEASKTPSSPFVFHVSGRSGAAPLAPLRDAGWLTAAIHPAMTFTGNPPGEVARMAEDDAVAVTQPVVEADRPGSGLGGKIGSDVVDADGHWEPLAIGILSGGEHMPNGTGFHPPASFMGQKGKAFHFGPRWQAKRSVSASSRTSPSPDRTA